MASKRALNSQSNHILEWAMSHGEMNRAMPNALSDRASLQQSQDLTQWLYVLALLCLISLLAFLYLAQASYVAREMDATGTLETTIQVLKKENNKLRLEIALKEDSVRIQQEARAMGFVVPQQVEYVEVVLNESATPSAAAASDSQPSSTADALSAYGWWVSILRQFRDWIDESTIQTEQLNEQ